MSEKLSVSVAVAQRLSVRAFLDKPVSETLVSDLLDKARGAPSGGNLQPWQVHVLMGEKLAAFKQEMRDITQTHPISSMPEYNVYPEAVPEPYNARRRQIGAQMYELMGVDRKDKQARTEAMMKNFTFLMPLSACSSVWIDVLTAINGGMSACLRKACACWRLKLGLAHVCKRLG